MQESEILWAHLHEPEIFSEGGSSFSSAFQLSVARCRFSCCCCCCFFFDQIDLFADTAAILISNVSNSYYGNSQGANTY